MLTMAHFFTRNARRYATRTATVDQRGRLTWADVNSRVNRLSNALIGLGLEKGDRVGVVLDNRREYLECYGLGAKAGIIPVPIHRQSTVAELAYLLSRSAAKALIVDESSVDKGLEAAGQVDNVRNVISMGQENNKGSLDYEELLASHSESEPGVTLDEDDILYLVFTSGTTGVPKAITITHGGTFSGIMTCLVTRLLPDEVSLVVAPCSFNGPIQSQIFPVAFMGGTLVFYSGSFDVRRALETIQRERVTHIQLVPSSLYRLIDCPYLDEYDISSLRTITYGSAPITATRLQQAIDKFGPILVQSYGAAEAQHASVTLSKEDHLDSQKLHSCGRKTFFGELKIVNDRGEEVRPGEVGEIILKGPYVLKRYWDDEELGIETFRDGWCYTKDLATIDEDGYIYIKGRRSEIVISGGVNVHPAETEEILSRHPGVANVAVIGVPDSQWGEALKAIVQLKPGSAATEGDLLEHCSKWLVGYKKPKSITIVDAMPLSPAGKVLKRVLQEKFSSVEESTL